MSIVTYIKDKLGVKHEIGAKWDNVSGKPTSFTPSAHTHKTDMADITSNNVADSDFSDSMDILTSHVNGYSATNPLPYRRKASKLWNYIKGKADSVYAAISHSHNASDINSGTLPIERGGTGATTAEEAEYNIIAPGLADRGAFGDGVRLACMQNPIDTKSGVFYGFRTALNLWNYIKGKLAGADVNIGGNAATATKATQDGSGNVITSTYITETDAIYNGTAYVTNDTHLLLIGEFYCDAGYDSASILVTSSFWGNQHLSADIISYSGSNNNNIGTNAATPSPNIDVSRIRLNCKSSFSRKFYWQKSGTDRFKLFVEVLGGNGYGHWSARTLGGESYVNRRLIWKQNAELAPSTATITETWTSGGYIKTNGSVGSVVSLTPVVDSNWCHTVFDVVPGDKVVITCKGGSSPRAWCFVDADNKIITQGAADITLTNAYAYAPANAVKFIGNNNKQTVASPVCTLQHSPYTEIQYNNSRVGSAESSDSSTKATQDGSGNVITSTYATKTELTNGLGTKQNTLTAQTAYSSKGSATKVPQITTNALGQVTSITEVTITQPGATSTSPKMDGTAAVGSESTFARGDHVHPTDTSRASSTHAHGNITNGGALQTTDVTIANGDKIVVTDSSDSGKVARTSIAFDGSTATQALTKKGTWETFLTSHQDISGKENSSNKVSSWSATTSDQKYPSEKLVKTAIDTKSDVGHSHTFNDVVPLQVKTFENVLATAADTNNANFYFGKLTPNNSSLYEQCRVRYRIYASIHDPSVIPSTDTDKGNNVYTRGWFDVEIDMRGESLLLYYVWNNHSSTTYRTLAYHELGRAKSAYITSGGYHILGIRTRDAFKPTSTGWGRDYKIEILELEGCSFEFYDTMQKHSDVYTSNYVGLSEIDGVNNGLRESGDDNDMSTIYSVNTGYLVGTNGMKMYSLCAVDKDGRIQSFTKTSGTGTTKTINDAKFRFPLTIYRYNQGTDRANGYFFKDNWIQKIVSSFDARYSCNRGTAFNTNAGPVYIEGTIDSDGYFTVSSNILTQTFVSGNVYIFVGYPYNATNATTNTYNVNLDSQHNSYYYDGTNLIPFEDGRYATKTEVTNAIEALDVSDSAVSGQVVSSVSETDGKISVARRALVAGDIPNLAASKITSGTFADERIASASKWNAKQDSLTFDTTPTENSSNPVTSAGVKSYVDSAVTGLYKYRGSVNTSYINALQNPSNGDVYNINASGTITNGEGGQPMSVFAGDNIAFVLDPITRTTYWDKMSSELDLSNFVDFDDIATATTAGVVKSSSTNGKVSVDASGVMTVNGWSGKQNSLASQTAYTSKGSATKVPQITTNSLGQVTSITEVTITQPSATTTSPKANGTAAVGTETTWAKGDHVHPTDTSRSATTHTHAVKINGSTFTIAASGGTAVDLGTYATSDTTYPVVANGVDDEIINSLT